MENTTVDQRQGTGVTPHLWRLGRIHGRSLDRRPAGTAAPRRGPRAALRPLATAVLAAVFLILALAPTMVPAGVAHAQGANAPSPATWMGDLGDRIGGVPLNQLAIPGTHDAGTSSLTPYSGFSPDASFEGIYNIEDEIDTTLENLGVNNLTASLISDIENTVNTDFGSMIYQWAQAQDKSIADQLNAGIRYFDLRPCPSPNGTDLLICHSLYGESVTTELLAVRAFSLAHPQEIIILDFSHLSGHGIADGSPLSQLLANDVKKILSTDAAPNSGDMLVPNSFTPDATVNDIWGQPGRIIVLDDDQTLTTAPSNTLLWPGQVTGGRILSPWPNVNNVADQSTHDHQYLECRCGDPANPTTSAAPDSLFVLQTNPTPDTALIGGALLTKVANDLGIDSLGIMQLVANNLGWPYGGPADLHTLADQADSAIIPSISQWVTGESLRGNLNIVQADWFEDSTLVPSLIAFDGTAPAHLFAVAAGTNFTCALTPSRTVSCWGDNTYGQATPPTGTFTSLSAGYDVACGIRTDTTLACWGNSTRGQTTAPGGRYLQVSVGGNFVCGLRTDARVVCWGTEVPYPYDPGPYVSISSGDNYVCAIRYDRHPSCVGFTNTVPDTTPTGDQFTQISAGMFAPCGLRADGTSVCWGGSYAPTPPSGTFSALSSASSSGDMCWIASDGTLQCATTGYGWTLPPPNGALLGDADPVRLGISFSAVSMGYNHACGVLTNHIPGNLFFCWGSGDDSKGEVGAVIPNGQANPYANAVLPLATVGQPFSYQFTSTYMWPAPTYSLAPSSGVPPGLTIDPTSGLLSGIPTTPGQYLFAVSADNGVTPGYGACNGPTGACNIVQLQVAPALAFTSPSSATFAAGTASTVTVSAQGSSTPALSETGALPSGVTFTDNGDGTATVSGTPARGAGGVYPLTLTAHNGAQPDATQSFTLTVTNPAPTTSSLSPASVQAGGAGRALTVAGTNFVPSSEVQVTTAGGTVTTLTPSAVAPDGTSLTVTIPAAAIAQPGTLQVAVVNGAPGGGTSALQPLFVTATGATVTSTSSSTGGTASTGGTGANTPGSVTVSGSGGSGTVAVALYSANPGTTPSFAASSAYFDAYVAPGSSYSAVTITDCALQGGSVALWYNARTGSWVQASNQSYNPATHCTTITVTASTTPSLAQLGGTPFAIANDLLLSLAEQGLPGSVPHQATLDGKTVALPDSGVAVPYHSSHSYSFPAAVTDSASGTVYFTSDPGFSGAVTANLSDTAVYQTMAQLVSAALSGGGIYGSGASGLATALTQQFAAVQADIKAGHTSQALTDLHSFAATVRTQAGKHIATATAQALLADAQLVYAHLGGSGTV